MAITQEPKSTRVSMKVISGTNPNTGAAILKSVNLGALKSTANTQADLQKAQNIINVLEPCLEYSLDHTEVTVVTYLEESA